MIEAAGWIGSICLAVCGIPQYLECRRAGNADGLAYGFLYLWFVGTIMTLGYVVQSQSWPLLINYAVNTFVLVSLIYYKHFPRSNICQK